MSAPASRQSVPATLDAWRQVTARRGFEGRVPLASLPRLASLLDASRLVAVGEGLCPACGALPVSGMVVDWPRAHGLRYLFCSVCGIKSFYVPRSHPDGYSINFRCLDKSDFSWISTTEFDGREWENNAGTLAPLGDA